MSDLDDQKRTRQRRVIRTALVLAAITLIIYLGFIMMGVANAG